MKRTSFLLSILSLLLSFSLLAQDCPKISVYSPISVKAGEEMVFTVNVSGSNLTYNWSISAGTIESGQGTTTIKVNTTGLAGQSVTATVELGGLPLKCASVSSSTSSIDAAPETELHLSGNYNTTRAFATEAELFAGDIMSGNYILESPKAVVFLYPGKTAAALTAIRNMTAILKAAFAKKGLKAPMYSIITAGKRAQTAYEMWIVPEGGKMPEATPAK